MRVSKVRCRFVIRCDSFLYPHPFPVPQLPSAVAKHTAPCTPQIKALETRSQILAPATDE
jgi:hypothetical protein